MLPSWRNRLYITIEQRRIRLLKLGRGLKPKGIASYEEAIPHGGKQQYSQIISDRLTQLLAQQAWQNAEVSVVLSNRLVRYAAISFPVQLQNYAEQEAFARHSLIQIHGTTAETWVLRLQRGKAGSPWLVSAIEQTLLDGLRKACAINQLKLVSVVPHLMPVFNLHRKTIKNKPAWLVINEPEYSLFVLLNEGGFIAFNGVCHRNLHEIPLLLDRENLACLLPEPCRSVYLCTTTLDDLSVLFKMNTPYEFNILNVVSPT